MGTIIFWIIVVIAGYAVLRKFKLIPKLIEIRATGARGSRTTTITEDNTIQEWSQLLLGMGGQGEELMKTIVRKIQEINIPDAIVARKQGRLGNSDNLREFISVIHNRYPDFEFWIGAIDRAGQLKLSWYLTEAIRNRVTSTMINLNRGGRSEPKKLRSSQRLGRELGRRLTEKITGEKTPMRVSSHQMTMDDREEFGAYMSLVHQAVLAGLEEMMNDLKLDFSKVDKHTEGFLNLS